MSLQVSLYLMAVSAVTSKGHETHPWASACSEQRTARTSLTQHRQLPAGSAKPSASAHPHDTMKVIFWPTAFLRFKSNDRTASVLAPLYQDSVCIIRHQLVNTSLAAPNQDMILPTPPLASQLIASQFTADYLFSFPRYKLLSITHFSMGILQLNFLFLVCPLPSLPWFFMLYEFKLKF